MALFTTQKDVSLRQYNTFGLDVRANYLTEISSVDELKEILHDDFFRDKKKLIIGGGSNILFTENFGGLVILNRIKGIEVIKQNGDDVIIKSGAGENWHDLVLFCVENEYGGVENLSLIWGTVGAAPMQNIGAYGVEIKDIFESLDALNLETLEVEKFDAAQCQFGYRESYFKREGKGKYAILNVTFRLKKTPVFNVDYGTIRMTLDEMGVSELSVKAISDAVIHIRQSKLPNPTEIGNAGSFFKNPEIPVALYGSLKGQYPEIPSYPINEETVKVPAGWLIERAGWKGKRFGEIGVHAKQALVLVNYGGGNGNDIRDLAFKIQASVKEQFGIKLTPEVNFI